MGQIIDGNKLLLYFNSPFFVYCQQQKLMKITNNCKGRRNKNTLKLAKTKINENIWR